MEIVPIQPTENPFLTTKISQNEAGKQHMDAFLFGTVGHAFYYVELLDFLKEAEEGDTVLVAIDNEGGMLHTGIVIATAIKNSKATVTTKAISIAASAAAVIFAAGHTKIALDYGYVMFHTASYISMGNAKDHKDRNDYIQRLVNKIMTEAYDGGLVTMQDVQDVMSKAKDIFIAGSVINSRVKGGE